MIKLRLFYYNKIRPNIKKVIIAAIVVGIFIGVGYFIFKPRDVYQYTDIHGNRGVARDCWRENGIAYCKEYYGNNIVKVNIYGKIK